MTIPIVDPAFAPQSTVLDETYKIAITRFDQRIRVGGMAELSGFNLGLNEDRRATLQMVTQTCSRAVIWHRRLSGRVYVQ